MKRLAALLCVICLTIPPEVAVAHPQEEQESQRPPTLVLKAHDVHQKAKLGSYCWSWDNGDGSGGATCADYFGYRWPRAQRSPRSGPATITIRYPEQPTEIDFTYWREVDDDRNPVGSGEQLVYAIAPRSAGHDLVWDVTFDLPDYRGHFYLAGFLEWDAGDASYFSHLRLR